MKYEIDKPRTELDDGYVTLILKYITLFILGWLGGWVFLVFVSSKRHDSSGIGQLLFDNSEITSVVIALFVVFILGSRINNKYKKGVVISIEVDIPRAMLILGLMNTMNGKCWEREISFDRLRIDLRVHKNNFVGNQRLLSFYERGVLISRINVDMTAWCRHPEIDIIIAQLQEIKRPKWH